MNHEIAPRNIYRAAFDYTDEQAVINADMLLAAHMGLGRSAEHLADYYAKIAAMADQCSYPVHARHYLTRYSHKAYANAVASL